MSAFPIFILFYSTNCITRLEMPIAKHGGKVVREEVISKTVETSDKEREKEKLSKTGQQEATKTVKKSKDVDDDDDETNREQQDKENVSEPSDFIGNIQQPCEQQQDDNRTTSKSSLPSTYENNSNTNKNNRSDISTKKTSSTCESSARQQQQTVSSSSASSSQPQQQTTQQQQQSSSSTTSSSSSTSSGSSSNSSNSNNNNGKSNCTKLLLCGATRHNPSDWKRKEVDLENNVNGSNSGGTCEGVSHQGSKWRKSSRKGSKKKDKNALKEMQENSGQQGRQANGSSDGVSGDSNDIQQCFDSANLENGNATTTTTNSSSQQQSSNAHDRKSCCFCWCCCCSCSCPSYHSLSVKNNQGKSGKENNRLQPSSSLEHYFNGNGEQPPSIEEIRLWAESFDKLMKCPWGRKVFRDFLKCEYSEENILFWLACEDLKKETNPEVIEEKARIIYEDYISILSPKEVSLDSRVREIINKNMVEPSPHTFDEAQLQIYTLMHRDSYPRFINSPMYRKLAQLPSPSRKGSTA